MNEKYPNRCTSFLLAKNYIPTLTKTTKFQGAQLPEILWFWSCVGIKENQYFCLYNVSRGIRNHKLRNRTAKKQFQILFSLKSNQTQNFRLLHINQTNISSYNTYCVLKQTVFNYCNKQNILPCHLLLAIFCTTTPWLTRISLTRGFKTVEHHAQKLFSKETLFQLNIYYTIQITIIFPRTKSSVMEGLSVVSSVSNYGK